VNLRVAGDLHWSRVWTVLLVLLTTLLVYACGVSLPAVTDQRRAEQVGREFFERYVPPGTLDRATVEVRRSQSGWMVVFRDVNLPCEQARWGPEACGMPTTGSATPVPFVLRDIFVCVGADYEHLGSVGGGTNSLDNADHCPPSQPAPVQLTATRRS
jgi:hypothetical protein